MNFYKLKDRLIFHSLILFLTLFSICVPEIAQALIITNESETPRDTIMSEMQQVLDTEFKSWYPLSMDSLYGGFFSDLDYQWKLNGRQD